MFAFFSVKDDTYFLSQYLFISHKVNFLDCILPVPYQDGGKRTWVLVKWCWLAMKSDGYHQQPSQTPYHGSRQSAGTITCLNYKSQSHNGQGWHLDIFKNSKRPDLNGNQFHFTNLGLLLQTFSCVFLNLVWDFMIIRELFEFYIVFWAVKPYSYFHLHP